MYKKNLLHQLQKKKKEKEAQSVRTGNYLSIYNTEVCTRKNAPSPAKEKPSRTNLKY